MKTFKQFNENTKALKNKAEKSGMPLSVLRSVYNRGVAAWKTGHRPGTTPEQWGFARVNSFTTKSPGTWGKADKDLADKVRGKNEETIDEVLDRPGALDSYRKKAKMKSDKARNTATAKLLRGYPEISKEKETIRKREKGQDMSDRVGVKQFRKSIGRGYNGKS